MRDKKREEENEKNKKTKQKIVEKWRRKKNTVSSR